jgi:hypothetical protein
LGEKEISDITVKGEEIMALPGIEDRLTKIEVLVRDPDDQLVKMIHHIMNLANPGHSFIADVDPDVTEADGRAKFSFDGDGSFFIKYVKKNGKKVEIKDGKIVEGYLNKIQ